jgi:hypothetical protein
MPLGKSGLKSGINNRFSKNLGGHIHTCGTAGATTLTAATEPV